MPVEVGRFAGFCHGVRAAVNKALSAASAGGPCAALGSLTHNAAVMRKLREAGIRLVSSVDEVDSGTVIIRSHGETSAVIEALMAKGIHIVDATCPDVKRVHEAVREYSEAGGAVIIAGDAEHPEVIGTAGWCAQAPFIVRDEAEARRLPKMNRALLVAQTTLPAGVFSAVELALRNIITELTVRNTICRTTSERQREAREMAARADVMLVVGDKESANTRALYETCRALCGRTYHLESAADLPDTGGWASDHIAITAGASTPDWSLKEVATRMNDLENFVPQEAEENVATSPEEAAPAATLEDDAAPAPNAEDAAETLSSEPEAPAASEAAADEETPAANETPVVAEAPAAAESAKKAAVESGESSFMADIEATLVTIRPGQSITGTVVQITEDEVCVNIGYKSDGLIRRADLVSTEVKVGDEIEVEVVKVNDGEGNVLLSQRNIVNRRNWDALMEQHKAGEFVEGVGKESVKGGLIAQVNGIRAFIPASQLSQRYVEKIEDFVGKEMRLKIIEVDRPKRRIVCSRKAVIVEEATARKKEIWGRLSEGALVKGIVRRLTDFGAFVDIGDIDGLVHVTDLSWGRVRHPSEVVSPNQEITVKILSLDEERERIQLGYKQTQPRPWDVAEEKYPAGSIIEGRVVRITTFGAFVEVEPGLDGLVHISQCALSRIAKVEDAVQVGQVVRVKVLGVDPQAKRISLSIRAALEEEAFNYSNELPGDELLQQDGDVYAMPVDYSQIQAEGDTEA